jgi:hypothetical protein
VTWLAISGLLKRIPWQLWAVLGLALLVLVCRWHWIGVGVDRCEARQAAQEAAWQAETARRVAEAHEAGKRAQKAAGAVVADTRKQTNESAEIVRTVWRDRIVHLPAECRIDQPDGMRRAGREAVAAARDSLPAAPNR